MADRPDAFIGTVPQNYDRYLGPVLFHGFADDLTARVPWRPGVRLLEVACGTGIVTRRLLARLHGQGTIVATDLNEAMLAHARREVPADPALEWQQADSTTLPFPEGAFDAVVCQFGLMFFPDKARAVREAFRVLKSAGVYLFNVWDAFEHNPIAQLTHQTVAELFPADPPQFYATPYGFYRPEPIVAWLEEAGFEQIEWSRVAQTGSSPTAADAATGLIDGNPIGEDIVRRRSHAVAEVKQALAARIAARLGDQPVQIPLRALVFTARRP
jgi:ubiquinone/menaquinone biosynthesis C-methylase UbiE